MSPFAITIFSDLSGSRTSEHMTDMNGLVSWLQNIREYPDKRSCPLISMARYGDQRTAKDSLRHDANVLATTGLTGDYDRGELPPSDAATMLEMAGISAVIVTTPSHGIKGNRWRVLVPFAQERTLSERHTLMGKLNALLGGVLASESWCRSQSFYVGKVKGAPYEVHVAEGIPIDQAPGIDLVEPVGPPAARPRTGEVDEFALLTKRARGGIEQIRAALAVIPNTEPDWERWSRVGMAVYNASGGSDDGLEAWREWSDRCPVDGRSSDSVDARWSHYRGSPPTELGMGSLVHLAKQEGYISPEQRRAAQITENIKIGEEIDELPLPEVLTLDDMLRDLIYIGDSGGVVHKITGRVRKKEAAAGEYAASKHRWIDDDGKEKEAPALKMWMTNPSRLSVDVLSWVPGATELCTPPEIVNGNKRAYNTWRGLQRVDVPEDWQERVKPFEQHIEYLVPIAEERRRFIQWLAHIVQRPEELPHTCYLMITEQTGVGRNWLGSVMVRVLRGYVAAGISLGPILDNKFNGRLSQKLLAVVDETREGMTDKRYYRGERFKGLITEEHRHIDTKYGLQTVEKNCCRWLMFSNHYDALPFESNDRRVVVIENPTVRKNPEYYRHIYSLVDQPQFFGSVRRYLEQVDLSDFNAGAHAPMSAAKSRALESMMSETDRAVVEFKETWPGDLAARSDIRRFVGGAINETHLTHAIARAGMVSPGKRINVFGGKDSVIIVHPENISRGTVVASSPSALADQISQIRKRFDNQDAA